MTPAEHYQRAESLLDYFRDGPDDDLNPADVPTLVAAVAHGLLAIAAEMGVPTRTPLAPASSPAKFAQVANLGYTPPEPEAGT